MDPTFAPPVKRSRLPAVLYACMAAGTLLSGVLPLAGSGDGKLFDAGPLFIIALVLPAVLLLIAAITYNDNADLAGLGGGAAIGAASLLGLIAVVLWKFSEGNGLGSGTYVITATAILGLVTFLVSLGVPSPGVASPIHWIAVAAGFVMCLGCTLVPSEASDYGPSWGDFNGFGEGSDVLTAFGNQLVIWVPLIALFVGAVKGGKLGVLFGLGGSLVLMWLIIAAKADIRPDNGYYGFSAITTALHPVAVVGAVAAIATMLIASANSSSNSSVPSIGAGLPGVGAVRTAQARWNPDPFGRYEIRFWNGAEWTDHVANNGIPSIDAPTWLKAPPFPVAAPAPPPAPPVLPALPVAPQLLIGHLLPPTADFDSTIPRVAVAPAPSVAELILDSGQRVVLVGAIVIGRAPRPQPGEPSATLLLIEDGSMSVSATHLLIRPTTGGVLVEDTGSTNGSTVVDPSGAMTVLLPTVRTMAAYGSIIHFGDRNARVVCSETS